MMGMAEMPMSHQLFEMVAFAGHEIAELTVLQPPPTQMYGAPAPAAAPAAPAPAAPAAPAAQASPWGAAPQPAAQARGAAEYNNPWGAAPAQSAAQPTAAQPAAAQPAAPKASNALPTPAPAPTVSVGTTAAPKAKPLSYAHAAGGTNPVSKPAASGGRGGRGGAASAGGRGAGGRGAGGRGGRGGYNGHQPHQHHMAAPLAIPTTEFDFQQSLKNFDKDKIAQDLSGKKGFVKTSEEVYQKDDFFDSLSCEALDKQQRGGRTRFDRRQPNSATFGYDGRGRGGRGGDGRGGRGGSANHYQRKPVEA